MFKNKKRSWAAPILEPSAEPEIFSPIYERLRPRTPVSYREQMPMLRSSLGSGACLSFRFESSKAVEIVRGKADLSVMSPDRARNPGLVYAHEMGTDVLKDYRDLPPNTPIGYRALSLVKSTPAVYKKLIENTYKVSREDVEKLHLPRWPSNQKLFKESAEKYAARKKIIVSKRKKTSFELCHNVAHRFWENQAQTQENIFVQTADFNSQQLAIENVISRLAVLLGQIEINQICERFENSNIGKRVAYLIKLPGCDEPWEVEVKAENAHILPHYDWTHAHLKLIAERLMTSSLTEVQKQGLVLKDELNAQHLKNKTRREKSKVKTAAVFLNSASLIAKNTQSCHGGRAVKHC